MGWFLPSHMDSGFIFGLLGLWHVFSVQYSYISNPRGFRSRAWYPSVVPQIPRALELWILLAIVLIFITKQLSHATDDVISGVIHTEHLMRFQHVVFSLVYLVYISSALISERTKFLPFPEGTLQGMFALGFLCELIVFHFGHHPGDNLESYVHMIMQLVLAALVALMLTEIRFPSSFVVAWARSMCLLLKGTWFFYIGILVNVQSAIPIGCAIPEDSDFAFCEKPMDLMRAKAIQILILNLQVLFILLFGIILYGVLMRVFGDPSKTSEYEEVVDEEGVDNQSVYLVMNKDGEFAAEVDKIGVPILNNLPRSLSRRMSKRNLGERVTPLSGKERPTLGPTSLGRDSVVAQLSVPSPISNVKTPLMVSSPLPKNIKNV